MTAATIPTASRPTAPELAPPSGVVLPLLGGVLPELGVCIPAGMVNVEVVPTFWIPEGGMEVVVLVELVEFCFPSSSLMVGMCSRLSEP